jgi:signal transduction histidine kinase
MRRKIFVLLLIASVLPIIGILAFLRYQTLNQQQQLAQRRLASVVSGVVGFYDRTGAGILTQIQTLTDNDDLKRTLLLTDEIGFIDQSALIKSTASRLNLLNLDYLTIIDPHGEVLAQGHDQSIFGFFLSNDQVIIEALSGQQVHSLGVRDIKGESRLMTLAAAPVWFKNRVIGVVMGGAIIDEGYLDDLRALSGAELILLRDGVIEGTTIPGNLDEVPIETTGNKFNSVELGGIPYKFGAFALDDFSGEKIADLLIGISTYDLKTAFDKLSLVFSIFAGAGFLLALALAWSFASKITNPIAELAELASRMATGDFEVNVKSSRKDEIGKLVNSFDSMAEDLRDYREKLVNSERMAAFTQMAQKVAHEIKNPLTPIQVSIQDLKRSFDENNDDFPMILEKSCSTILEEVSSLARIVREFSEFARFPSPQLATENLNELIIKFADLYASDIEANRLVLDFSEEELMVNVDRDHMKRAVYNIIKNAFEASGQTGKVELKTYRENNMAVIEVVDTGQGFSAQAKKNLYSPYFTTKPDGSGLGLVIVKKIISEHDGFIEINDEVGLGTAVKLKLRMQNDENTLS